MTRSALILAGLTSLIVVGLALLLARSFSIPLPLLTDFASHAAEGDAAFDFGDAARKSLQGRRDEIGKIAVALSSLREYVSEAAAAAEAIANGDLTVEVKPKSDRDILGNAFNEMLHGLRELIGQVRATSDDLASTSQSLGTSANQTGARVEEMSAQAQELAGTAEQLRSLVARLKLHHGEIHARAVSPSVELRWAA
jgi:methyl-accepting chemotaxis protein